ncbi:MAG: hypothetical protein JWN32_1912 [Solirubrobacterales bacterium]|nr:hypothetical protein [Solirubrobacterales bacterium]
MSRTSLSQRYRSTSRVASVLDAGSAYVETSRAKSPFEFTGEPTAPGEVSPGELADMLDALAGLLDRHLARRADPRVALRVPPELLESIRGRLEDEPDLPRLLAVAADELRDAGRVAGPPAEALRSAASVADAEVEAVYRRLTSR